MVGLQLYIKAPRKDSCNMKPELGALKKKIAPAIDILD
jgi:hypothetical protein